MANITTSTAHNTSTMDYDYDNTTLPPGSPPANGSMSSFDAGIELLANSLHTYYTPLLVLLGSIGNIISIYVFYVSKLRMHSTSLYLSVLAISDSIFLLQLLPPWLNAMQITNLFHRPGFCQVIVYSTYASCCCSAWLVVAFTIERFVAVLYPLRRSRMCTVARAKTVIGLLVVGSMVANLPVLKYASPSVNDCNIDSEYIEVAARFNVADTMVSFTLPLGLIMVLNSRIVSKVYRRGRERRALQAAAARTHRSAPLRSQQRVTRMLLLVSSVFVVLNLPAYAMRIAAYAFDLNTGEYSGRWAALQQLALTFFNTNFGINFILYCLSGQNFRRELCLSVPCLRVFRRRIDDLQLTSRNNGRTGSVTTSYVSANEASTSNVVCEPPSRVRRHHSESFIERWTFDNSRAARAQSLPPAQPHISRRNQLTLAESEAIELQDLDSYTSDGLPVYRLPETAAEENIQRPFPFLLFPLARIIAPKTKRSGSVASRTPSN